MGRSNAGKSTFINVITNNGKLAKTSNTPGKTRLINHFEVTSDKGNFIIADLPGYGYAKVSKTMQNEWQKNLEEYLLKRENLAYCFLFLDARHGMLENDINMINWLILNKVPFINILTKCDLSRQGEVQKENKKLKTLQKQCAFYFQIQNRCIKKKFMIFWNVTFN